jgi:hypothetical protein
LGYRLTRSTCNTRASPKSRSNSASAAGSKGKGTSNRDHAAALKAIVGEELLAIKVLSIDERRLQDRIDAGKLLDGD